MQQVPQPMSKKASFIFLSILVLVMLLTMAVLEIGDFLPAYLAQKRFIQTTCVILEKRIFVVPSSGRGGPDHVPRLAVVYLTNGSKMESWAYTNANKQENMGIENANKQFDKYLLFANYPCWYDPRHIDFVVLDISYPIDELIFDGIFLGFMICVVLFAMWWGVRMSKRMPETDTEDFSSKY